MNDKQQQEKVVEINLTTVVAHGALSAVGMATFLLAPLPLIVSFFRLQGPAPKISAIIGALFCLLLLNMPASIVVLLFVVSLFVADAVFKGQKLSVLLLQAELIAAAVAFLIVFVLAQQSHEGIVPFWIRVVDTVIQGMQGLNLAANIEWPAFRTNLIYAGPLMFLTATLFAIWLSIGIAAHLNFIPASHPLSGSSLRKVRIPAWVGLLFLVCFVAGMFLNGTWEIVSRSLIRLFAIAILIQGMITLSHLLARMRLRGRVRTAIYSIAILLGSPALVGLGLIDSFFWNHIRKETKGESP